MVPVELILLLLAAYVTMFVSWILYLAVMKLKQHRRELGPVAKVHAYLLLAIALIVDLFLTLFVGTLLFLAVPKELTLTARLKRHQIEGGWRARVAAWICQKLLNQFDPGGKHC